jgi:hypothetical protein
MYSIKFQVDMSKRLLRYNLDEKTGTFVLFS